MTIQIDDVFIREWHPRYDLTEDDEEEYERLVATVALEMKSMGTISKKTFLDIWSWKGAMRVLGLTTIYVEGQKTKAVTAAEDEYETRYATAFRRAASEPPERKLGALLDPGVKLPGVGAPTGSTLIHFIHPQTMPIIDSRTAGILFAFGRIATAECWLETYEEFRKAINKISRDCPGWTLRQIDRALFAYHKQALGKEGQDIEKRPLMSGGKVFVWILEIPKQPAPEKVLFSAVGSDREEAENKIVAYIKSLPPAEGITPELFRQWVKVVAPLTPEVREGVWLLPMTTGVSIQLDHAT